MQQLILKLRNMSFVAEAEGIKVGKCRKLAPSAPPAPGTRRAEATQCQLGAAEE